MTRLVFLLLCAITASPVFALTNYVPRGATANPPLGWVDFCGDPASLADCTSQPGKSFYRLSDLDEVNRLVNALVLPKNDIDVYRRDEFWTLPGLYGDCEDYVLLKRRMLLERGWPSWRVSIAVVFDEKGDGHAVLLARTYTGEDLVLDNKTDMLRRWDKTPYFFVKKQGKSPNQWVSLSDPRQELRGTITTSGQ